MTRITLNVILHAVLGAEGQELERLREILPPAIKLGSKLALIPVPQWDWGRWSPWGRFFQYRREYDAIGDRLIDKAQADPSLASHDDVLALMLQSRYEDGSPMTRAEIADELITMLAAGHETTATTLAWAVERLQRHPQLLDRRVADLDAGSEDLLTATVFEILRTRPRHRHDVPAGQSPDNADRSVDGAAGTHDRRQHRAVARRRIRLPRRSPLRSRSLHFPTPRPRGIDSLGGGVRRCIGAAFATMEIRVVLRTLLRDYVISPSNARDEGWQSRRVALAPARGARVCVRPRSGEASDRL